MFTQYGCLAKFAVWTLVNTADKTFTWHTTSSSAVLDRGLPCPVSPPVSAHGPTGLPYLVDPCLVSMTSGLQIRKSEKNMIKSTIVVELCCLIVNYHFNTYISCFLNTDSTYHRFCMVLTSISTGNKVISFRSDIFCGVCFAHFFVGNLWIFKFKHLFSRLIEAVFSKMRIAAFLLTVSNLFANCTL